MIKLGEVIKNDLLGCAKESKFKDDFLKFDKTLANSTKTVLKVGLCIIAFYYTSEKLVIIAH